MPATPASGPAVHGSGHVCRDSATPANWSWQTRPLHPPQHRRPPAAATTEPIPSCGLHRRRLAPRLGPVNATARAALNRLRNRTHFRMTLSAATRPRPCGRPACRPATSSPQFVQRGRFSSDEARGMGRPFADSCSCGCGETRVKEGIHVRDPWRVRGEVPELGPAPSIRPTDTYGTANDPVKLLLIRPFAYPP